MYKALNRKLECDPKPHSYDKSKITITQAGITRNMYDLIQDARNDTEIYPTLEKYGCIDKMIMDTGKVYGELVDIQDTRDVFEANEKANQLWISLPIDERKKFNNDIKTFFKYGETYLLNKIETEKTKFTNSITPTVSTEPTEQIEKTITTEVNNNDK